MDEKGISVADALALRNSGNDNSNNDGWGGNNCWWIIIIILFLGMGNWGNWGGRGYGYGGGAGGEGNTNTIVIPPSENNVYGGAGFSPCCTPATQQGLTQAFNFNQLDNGIRSLERGLCDGFYTVNMGISNLGTSVQGGISGLDKSVMQGFNSTDKTVMQGFNTVQSSLCQGFNGTQNAVNQGVNAIQNTLNQGFNLMQSDMAQTNFNLKDCCCQTKEAITNSDYRNQTAFNAMQNQLSSCCCDLGRGQENIKYAIAQATCDITANADKNADRIINHLVQSEMDALRTELQSAQFQLSQAAQTNNIINRLSPTPVPAWPVQSPYVSLFNNSTGCGCNSCC